MALSTKHRRLSSSSRCQGVLLTVLPLHPSHRGQVFDDAACMLTRRRKPTCSAARTDKSKNDRIACQSGSSSPPARHQAGTTAWTERLSALDPSNSALQLPRPITATATKTTRTAREHLPRASGDLRLRRRPARRSGSAACDAPSRGTSSLQRRRVDVVSLSRRRRR